MAMIRQTYQAYSRLFGILCCFITCASFVFAQADKLKTTPIYAEKFENVTAGTLPGSIWDDSGWTGAKVPLKVVDSGDPRYGKVLEARVNGYAQLVLAVIRIEKDTYYRVSMDASSKGMQQIRLAFRLVPGPYTTYLSSQEATGEEMRHISFIGKTDTTTDNVALMFYLNGFTTMRFDNITIEKITGELPPPAPPIPGNQLPNAGFELGRDGWFMRGHCEVTSETGAAYEGRRALKMHGDPGQQTLLSSSWLQLSPDTEYVLRARVKSLSDTSSIQFALADYCWGVSGGFRSSDQIPIAKQDGWKEVIFPFSIQQNAGKITRTSDQYLHVSASGDLLLDALEVKVRTPESETEPYRQHAVQELAITCDQPLGVATLGERVTVHLLSNPALASTRLQICDEANKPYKEIIVRLDKNGEGQCVLPALPPGYWHLITAPAVGGAGNTQQRLEGEAFIAVVPPMPAVSLDQWHFGTHVVGYAPTRQACWKLGLRWDRLHDTSGAAKWDSVQGKGRDAWVFNDTEITDHMAKGYKLLGVLANTPSWLPKPQGEIHDLFTPEDFPLWQEYARQVAAHWTGSIDTWEVGNEFNLGGMSAEHYAKILQAAWQGVKAGNPQARVVGLGGAAPIDNPWLKDVIKLGGGRYCDAISFHGYGITTWASLAGPDKLIADVAELRAAMKDAGTPNLPIWDSESGLDGVQSCYRKFNLHYWTTASDAADMLPKAIASARAADLERYFYYSSFIVDHTGSALAGFTMSDFNDSLKMPFQPMAVAIALLEGRTYQGESQQDKARGLIKLTFTGRGATVYMLWRPEGTMQFTVPKTMRAINMWGRDIPIKAGAITINQHPIYLYQPATPGTLRW